MIGCVTTFGAGTILMASQSMDYNLGIASVVGDPYCLKAVFQVYGACSSSKGKSLQCHHTCRLVNRPLIKILLICKNGQCSTSDLVIVGQTWFFTNGVLTNGYRTKWPCYGIVQSHWPWNLGSTLAIPFQSKLTSMLTDMDNTLFITLYSNYVVYLASWLSSPTWSTNCAMSSKFLLLSLYSYRIHYAFNSCNIKFLNCQISQRSKLYAQDEKDI